MVPAKVVEKIARDLDLSKEELINGSLKAELCRRLAAYKYTDYLLTKKYGVNYADFLKKRIIAKKKYSFEVEDDSHCWDQALDGIKTLEKYLRLFEI
ncbi:hypothetical protein HZB07_01380 [Candidatus Saganbacteria bacterium]|nr:hypothetical protein [Candidatus Saganbacteria bacterium]